MSYTHTTFAQARQRLANELGDSNKVFWTDTELGRYIVESLRWWGLNALYFRETGQIETVIGRSFYHIETDLEDGSSNLLQSLTVTDRELINDLNYLLMEPQITNWAGGWVGTEMFTLGEIVDTLSDSRDEFLKLTACIADDYDISPVTTQRVSLPEDHIRILKAYITHGSGPLPLQVVDQVQVNTTVPAALTGAVSRPNSYSVSYSPQLTVDLWPGPLVSSTLNIQGVRSGSALTPTSSATTLLVPDDASPLLKYRTLMDLMSGDGLVRCPQIAEYAERRYMDGLVSMSRYIPLLWARIGDKRVPISSVEQWDQLKPRWRTETSAPPEAVAMANWNTVAVRPTPDDEYVIEFECVRKAILPTVDGDFIQVGREHMQAIYDYAAHIALIKSQGMEFEISMSRYESAMQTAEEYRMQTAAQSYLYPATQLPSFQERWFRPIRRRSGAQQASEDRQLVET